MPAPPLKMWKPRQTSSQSVVEQNAHPVLLVSILNSFDNFRVSFACLNIRLILEIRSLMHRAFCDKLNSKWEPQRSHLRSGEWSWAEFFSDRGQMWLKAAPCSVNSLRCQDQKELWAGCQEVWALFPPSPFTRWKIHGHIIQLLWASVS